MLIDLLLAEPTIDNVDPSSNYMLKNQLIQAQKFELSEEFASTAEALMSSYDTIAHAIPHCRLPFPNTWFEVAQQHRARFMQAGIHVPEVQGIPKRVGFLLSEATVHPYRFVAHLFWELDSSLDPKYAGLPNYKAHASHMAMGFDLQQVEGALELPPEVKRDYRYIKMASAPEWVKASSQSRGQLTAIAQPIQTIYKSGLPEYLPPETAQLMFELGAADWSGETVFILAVLALYNTVNAVESASVTHTKINKRREKLNKPPLQEYYVLKIHPRIKKWVKPSTNSSDRHAELRAHMVRGHWKVRKTGIYFWRSHMRGDATRGLVDKGYELD